MKRKLIAEGVTVPKKDEQGKIHFVRVPRSSIKTIEIPREVEVKIYTNYFMDRIYMQLASENDRKAMKDQFVV